MSKENKQPPVQAVKVTMPGKRVAIVRQPKISDSELAAKMLGSKSKNQVSMVLEMQRKLVEILLLEIDGKKLDHKEKSNLDELLNIAEYNCLTKVINDLSGGADDSGEEVTTEAVLLT